LRIIFPGIEDTWIITTDYYYKSTFFPSDYVVSFDGGTYMRRMP